MSGIGINCLFSFFPLRYWPTIDDALRKAAYERGIQVRIMGSQWNHTLYGMKDFLKSLGSLNDIGDLKGKIEAVSNDKCVILPS